MLFKELNLNDIHSELIEILKQIGDDWAVDNGCDPSYCPTGVSNMWEWFELDHKNYIWNRCINHDNKKK